MEIQELGEQNPWWKDERKIEEDFDILKWKEKKYHWIPELIKNIKLEPFALHVITGPRQAGKTTTLKLLIKTLLIEKKANPRSIFYLNCEDLADFKELENALKIYLEFKDLNNIKNSVIILDEVTMPKEWYRALKFLIDAGKLKNDIIIASGSSTLALKKEVELFPGRRGKGEDFVLYPLSFRSFLKVLDPELEKQLPKIEKIQNIEKKVKISLLFEKELSRHLKDYMDYGGFPLSLANFKGNKEEAKRVYLSWIKNAVLKDNRSDIIARQIIRSLVESLQSDSSWESISKKIEIKSPKTVSAYVDFFKSIFVVNVLYNIDVTGRIKFGKNKKIYFRDPLLLEIFEDWTMTKCRDKYSALAESLVIEHLSRFFQEKVFFWKNGFEVDAVILEKEGLYGFEVKYTEDFKEIKRLNNFKKLFLISKKVFTNNKSIPVSIFLSLFDV